MQAPSRQESEVSCREGTTSSLLPQVDDEGQDGGGDGAECTPPMSRIGLNDHKAGMEGLDRDRINQIILEASKGSKFYKNEVQKEKQVSSRIEQMRAKMKCLTESQKASALKTADREVERLEALRGRETGIRFTLYRTIGNSNFLGVPAVRRSSPLAPAPPLLCWPCSIVLYTASNTPQKGESLICINKWRTI